MMGEPIRKETSLSLMYSIRQFFRREDEREINADLRVGEYRVDYTMPSRAEIHAHDAELEELFANSKTISVKK